MTNGIKAQLSKGRLDSHINLNFSLSISSTKRPRFLLRTQKGSEKREIGRQEDVVGRGN